MKCTVLNSIWAVSLLVSVAMPIKLAAQEQSGKVKECSDATLRGSFGYTSTGTLLPVYAPPPFAGPFGEVGIQTFDGRGHTDATATLSANGNIQQVTIEGTYTINSDCTGSMTLNVSPLGVTVHADFVIDRDGTELRAIGTDSGLVETRVYRKQFRGDHEEHSKLTGGARQLLPSLLTRAPVQLSSISKLQPARAYFASKTKVYWRST